ncbi:MAG: hypothetical protein HYR71_01925 [Chloroflexi bacterium]|nr:hypothetical protein [Chloroflexota bacterium]
MRKRVGSALALALLVSALAYGASNWASTDDVGTGGAVASSQTTMKPADKSGLRLAPELKSDVWLNGAPTSLAEQRGKVVLVDFWTFG